MTRYIGNFISGSVKKNKKLLRIVILFSNLIGEIKKIHKSDFNVVLCVYLCNVSRRIKRREI